MDDIPLQPSQLILVTGPARSGKSEFAEQFAATSGRLVHYIATAWNDPDDAEWQERIEQHRRRRPGDWLTLEVQTDLVSVLQRADRTHCLLVDSLGSWLTNLLEQDPHTWEITQNSLVSALQTTAAMVILVSEETGWGVVPAYPLGRLFRDRLGTLTRQIGSISHHVYLVTGGYALNLTQLGTPLGHQSPSA